MDWPVWLDALNLLQLPAVPYTLLVDEDGRIESVDPTQEAFLAFMEKPPREMELQSSQPWDRSPEWKMPRLPSDEALEVSAWLEAGQGFFQGAWSSHSMTCLKAFQQALLLEPENGWIHFRLGVVYGRLFDEDLPTHAVVCQGHLALEAGPGIGSQSIHLEETLAAVWPAIGQALRFL